MIVVLGREGIWKRHLFVSVAVGLMALVPYLSHAQVTVDERLALGQPLAVIAHRAVGGGAPENSLAGIQYAIDRGIDMVEVDVRMTSDGHYILMHDPSLARTTNVKEVFPDGAPALGPGDPNARRYRTFDFALEDVARLRLLDPLGNEHPVAKLDAALSLAEGRVLLLMELKDWEVESLAQLLEAYDTDNLLFWTKGDRQKLAETSARTGVGVSVSPASAANFEWHLNREVELHGPLLKLAGVSFSTLLSEHVSMVSDRGVRADVDTRMLDPIGPNGSSAPWVQTVIDSGAAAVWTSEPDEMLQALGR